MMPCRHCYDGMRGIEAGRLTALWVALRCRFSVALLTKKDGA